mmetsp:Transcript_18363/g.52568  ORF Transcript_18363/g.52568 Transcript_18363/m.52568 type:complete len:351 (+) Transcript_18363:2088-3140(+)
MWSCSSASRNAVPISLFFFRHTIATASAPFASPCEIAPGPPTAFSSPMLSSFLYGAEPRTSSGVPQMATRPPSSKITLSNCLKREAVGCMTTTRVRLAIGAPRTSCSKRWVLVPTSTEAKGSSITTTSDLSMYAARARATRARCPPESRMPWEPIITMSAPGKVSRSGVSAAAWSAWKYFFWSKVACITTFSRKVPSKIQGTCEQKASLPESASGHVTTASSLAGKSSPNKVCKSAVLPEATEPITATSSPRRMVISKSWSVAGESGRKEKLPLTCSTGAPSASEGGGAVSILGRSSWLRYRLIRAKELGNTISLWMQPWIMTMLSSIDPISRCTINICTAVTAPSLFIK